MVHTIKVTVVDGGAEEDVQGSYFKNLTGWLYANSFYLVRTLYYWYYESQYITISYTIAICCAGTHTGVYPNCRRKWLDLEPFQ